MNLVYFETSQKMNFHIKALLFLINLKGPAADFYERFVMKNLSKTNIFAITVDNALFGHTDFYVLTNRLQSKVDSPICEDLDLNSSSFLISYFI